MLKARRQLASSFGNNGIPMMDKIRKILSADLTEVLQSHSSHKMASEPSLASTISMDSSIVTSKAEEIHKEINITIQELSDAI